MTISYSDNFSEFNALLQPELDAGLSIVDAEFDGQSWYATTVDNGRSGAYNYNTNLAGLEKQIQSRWSQGYSLLDVEYGGGYWFATFERAIADDSPTNENAYNYNSDPSAIGKQIQQRRADGLDLADIEYGDGYWFATFEDRPGDNLFSSSQTVNDLSLEINRTQADGYDLVDVEYTDGTWTSVFQDFTGLVDTTYSISTSRRGFFAEVESKEAAGYELLDLEYGNGHWVGVYGGVVTPQGDKDSATSTDLSPADVVNQNLLLENSQFTFDPDYAF